jgi:hypothetical protein
MVKFHLPVIKLNPVYEEDVYVQTAFLVSLLALATFSRGNLGVSLLLFWAGGIVGAFFPLLDHLVYIFFLRPNEESSKEIAVLVAKKNFREAFNLLVKTRRDRTKLVIHTVLFQLVMLVLTFLTMTSSANLFGKGLVLAFSLHLLVDQLMDFVKTGSIDRWLKDALVTFLPESVEKRKAAYYLGAVSVVLLFMAVFM